jgi:hypothetical protein
MRSTLEFSSPLQYSLRAFPIILFFLFFPTNQKKVKKRKETDIQAIKEKLKGY